jgi:hypothetical protein
MNANDSKLRALKDSPIHRYTWIRIVPSTALTRALLEEEQMHIINAWNYSKRLLLYDYQHSYLTQPFGKLVNKFDIYYYISNTFIDD